MRKRRRSEAQNRCAEGLLHPGKSALRPGQHELRSQSSRHQNPAQGDQGRLASVRARTIAPLSLRGEKFRRNDAANAFLSRRRDVTTDPVEIAMILAGILAVVAIVFVL
jgi:hypothetical protein